MNKLFLVSILFSFTINAMEEAPNNLCRLATLPSDVQNIVCSYLTFDKAEDNALLERVRAEPPFLPVMDSVDFAVAMEAQAKIIFEQVAPVRTVVSEDGKKWLTKYTEANDSTVGLYDVNTQRYTRLLWVSSDRHLPA